METGIRIQHSLTAGKSKPFRRYYEEDLLYEMNEWIIAYSSLINAGLCIKH